MINSTNKCFEKTKKRRETAVLSNIIQKTAKVLHLTILKNVMDCIDIVLKIDIINL